MVDAWAAGEARDNIASRLNNPQLANALVPIQPNETQALERARLLMSTVSTRLNVPSLQLAGSGPMGTLSPFDVQDLVAQLRASALKVRRAASPSLLCLPLFPWWAPARLERSADCPPCLHYHACVPPDALQIWPRLEQLMKKPGAQELVASLNTQLARRFAARSIKFVFGAQSQLGQLAAVPFGAAAPAAPAGMAKQLRDGSQA